MIRYRDKSNTRLEASRAPVDELDGSLRLDARDRAVHIFRDDVAAVQEAYRHVLAMTRIALKQSALIEKLQLTALVLYGILVFQQKYIS